MHRLVFSFVHASRRGFALGALLAFLAVGGARAQQTYNATISPLFAFTGANGAIPQVELVQGSDGSFYGTTTKGGKNSYGTIFKITSTGAFTFLYSFDGTVGAYPFGKLIESGGNFYGVTKTGGTGNHGIVYMITPAGVLTTLHQFDGDDGSQPEGGLLLGTDKNFYGTTLYGGPSNDGAVYQMTPAGVVTPLAYFDGTNGANPFAGLVQASDGSFYGTTRYGGSSNLGTVFQLTTGNQLDALVSFTGGNGSYPTAELAPDGAGNFYGTTEQGGAFALGTVFEVTATGQLTTLISFTGQTGAYPGANPDSSLLLASDGNFYGVTNEYQYSLGTVFKMTPGGVFTLLGVFGGSAGQNPYPGLVQGIDGSFYGTTAVGGNVANDGAIFKAALLQIPNITSAASVGGVTGTAFSYQTTADNVPTSYSVNGLPTGLSFNTATGLISGLPTVVGVSAVTLTASNAAGYATTTLTINILPPPPVVAANAPPSGQVGVPYSFQLAATNNPTVFSASFLPPGLTVDQSTGLVSGTPTLAGTYSVPVSAANAGGSGAAVNFSILIEPAVPVILGVPAPPASLSAYGQIGQPFFYVIIAANAPTSFSAQGLPPGLNVDTRSGLISGTPTATGTTAVTLTASNAGGTSAAVSLMLTFDTLSLAPAIPSTTTPVPAQKGENFSYAITAANPPISSFAAVGLPPGLTLDPATGIISGMPTLEGTYTASISATNAYGTGTAALALVVSLPAANISAVNILSPPADIRIVQNELVDLTVSVEALPGTLQRVYYAVYDAAGTTLLTPLGDTAAARDHETWMPTALGDFTLRVTAVDTAGDAIPADLPIHVVASAAPPPVSVLLSGLDGKSFAAGSSLSLVALATDAGGNPLTDVHFFADGVPIPAADGSPGAAHPGLHRQDAVFTPFAQATLKLGSLLNALFLTVVGTDGNGVTQVSNGATIRVVAAPNLGDTLSYSITGLPANNTLTARTTAAVTVTPDSPAGSAATVQFFAKDQSTDAQVTSTLTAAPYTFNFALPTVGTYALTTIATDANGTSQSSTPVIVNAVAPPVPVVTLAVAGDSSVEEGTNGKVIVRRDGDMSAPLTVRYKLAGAARPGIDYKPPGGDGVVVIPAGAAQAKIKIKTIDNQTVDGTRVAKIKLLAATDGSYMLGVMIVAKIKITDND